MWLPKERIKSTKCRQRLVENSRSSCKPCATTQQESQNQQPCLPLECVWTSWKLVRNKMGATTTQRSSWTRTMSSWKSTVWYVISGLLMTCSLRTRAPLGRGSWAPLTWTVWSGSDQWWVFEENINWTWGLHRDLHVLSLWVWTAFADVGCRLLFVKRFIWTVH